MSAMAEARSRRPRRRFADELKQQAVRLVLDEGKSVTAVARELNVVASALADPLTDR
jgi:transposase